MKIKILPDVVANKIAAGEVIERPASVVKELVENAIDAGADRISVTIENGGRRLVRVSDNGFGMSREDAMLSIERHATSKIADVEDIDHITTLGFRGEALPSIASVSKTVIETRRREDDFGVRLTIDGGILRNVTDTGRDEGTVLEVRNLFFNVPARRKFLRTEETEIRYIKAILYGIVVSNPGIHISLESDGRELFSYQGGDRDGMFRQVFGKSLAERMIPLEFSQDDFTVQGLIGRPDDARKTGTLQYIIVNGRPIASRGLARAVLDGYGGTMARGMFPPYALYIETDPGRVDVNVHPTKREIRMHREFVVQQAIREHVAIAVGGLSAAPEMREQGPMRQHPGRLQPVAVYNPPLYRWQPDIPRVSDASPPDPDHQTALALEDNRRPNHMEGIGTSTSPSAPVSPGIGEPVETGIYEGPAFWQLKNRYIITSMKEGALIIDQHVAHERILYEEVLAHFRGRKPTAQQLLFPVVADFSAADYDIMSQMIPLLNQIGFGIREFGERSVIVDAVPAWFTSREDEKMFDEFIDEMRLHGRITSGYLEKLAAAIACRAATKSGKPLNQDEMHYLVDTLFATKEPFVCPHGRPTVIRLTIEELDRRFGR